MSDPSIQFILYDTLFECMASYFDCEVSEIKEQKGVWEWADYDGKKHSVSMEDAINDILSNGKTWGWVENKKRIHFWKDKSATKKQIIRTLAHELGHTHRPFHRDTFKEEQKAEKYAEVAETAYDIMGEINN